jgi:hypothetical protein
MLVAIRPGSARRRTLQPDRAQASELVATISGHQQTAARQKLDHAATVTAARSKVT